MHYYKRDIGKYYKKAGRLTMLQHGAYTMLMDSCYDREVFPTLEQAIDWCWASTDEEIEAVKFVLNKLFFEFDGVFKQNQIVEVLAQYHKNAKTNKGIAIEREAKRRAKSTKREPTVDEPPPNYKLGIKNYELEITNQELRITNQKPKDQKIISSKLDMTAENQILDFLIKRSGKQFKHVPANIKLITARIKEGHSESEILSVIEKKVKEWESDPKMAKYIRPATLFNAEKFNQYVGELGVETPDEKRTRELNEWATDGETYEQ